MERRVNDQPTHLTIYIQDDHPGGHAAFSPVETIAKAARGSIQDVNIADVKRGIDQLVASVLASLPDETVEARGYQLDEVRFTVGISATGQVSLMSIAGASTSTQVGIEFTLKRKPR